MTKKLLAVLLAGMMVFTIAGCNNGETENVSSETEESTVQDMSDETEETEDVSSETEESTVQDMSDETEETDFMFSLQVKGTDEAVLIITYADGTVEETGSQGWFGNGTQTVAEAMKEWEIESIEAKCGDAPFLGWVGYEMITQEDENGFEETVEKPLIMSEVYYTTEDLMNEIMPEQDIVYYAVFEFECSECEENKACEVHYIDDDVYYICADCYEEFAKDMGLN